MDVPSPQFDKLRFENNSLNLTEFSLDKKEIGFCSSLNLDIRLQFFQRQFDEFLSLES